MSTVPVAHQPNVTVQAQAGTPTWQSILAAIMAAFQAVEPIVIHVVPPPVAAGLEIGGAVAPIIIQSVITATTPQ